MEQNWMKNVKFICADIVEQGNETFDK